MAAKRDNKASACAACPMCGSCGQQPCGEKASRVAEKIKEFKGGGERISLAKLPLDTPAVITKVGGEGALRLRLLDMGLIPKTVVSVTEIAPMGDPIRLYLRGYCLTLRLADAECIETEIGEEKA